MDRPVILRTPSTQCAELNSEDEFSPAVRDAVVEDGEVAARFETSDMADELETALQEPPALVLQRGGAPWGEATPHAVSARFFYARERRGRAPSRRHPGSPGHSRSPV